MTLFGRTKLGLKMTPIQIDQLQNFMDASTGRASDGPKVPLTRLEPVH